MTQASFKAELPNSEYNSKRRSVYAVNQPSARDYTNFEALYDQYSPKAFGYIIKHTNTKQDAEELLTNVYLKIWINIKNFEQSSNIEKQIIAIILAERRAFNKQKISKPLSESKYFNWAYNTFMIAAVIYLYLLK